MQTIPEVPKEFWLIGAGVAVLGVAYLWIKGLKGAASGLATGAGNVAAGLVDGVGNAGVAVTNATGNAFQDITQATLQIPKTSVEKCAADTAKGDTLAASFSCKASSFLSYLFSPTPKPDPSETPLPYPMTAPGGGIVSADDYLLGGGSPDFYLPSNGGVLVNTGIDPNSILDPLLSYNPGSALGINTAPSDPTPLNSEPTLVNIAGLRG